MASEQSFDLSQLSADSWRRGRSKHAAYYALTACFVGAALLFLDAALGSSRSVADWTLLGITETIAGAMIAILAIAIWKTRKPPVWLSVGADGIRLRWPSGHEEFSDWNTTARSAVLLDYSGNPTVVQRIPQFQWELRRWASTPAPLTKAAFDAIESGARSRGLIPNSTLLPTPTWGWAPCRAVRFSRPSDSAR
jgi:hypothetical protein